MKKIIPFNNVLKFDTDVREITAISLEHELNKYPDMISGVFYISGEYKITDGQLDREKFNFELPFDIALSNNYELDTLLIDIDDFRYDLISDNELKVNIDLYIDGEEVEDRVYMDETVLSDDDEKLENLLMPEDDLDEECVLEHEEDIVEALPEETIDVAPVYDERIDLLKEMLTNNKENTMEKETNINVENNNDNTNVLNNNESNPDDTYVTYRVYKVLDTDTLDTILEKYKITKEMLADYNDIENILPGDKLIIPTNEK